MVNLKYIEKLINKNSKMKQKFLLSIMTICLVATAFAQGKKSVMGTIVSIIKVRQNEFVNIRGNLFNVSKDSIKSYYESKESFGAATEFITYTKKQPGSVFTSFFDYKVGDELIKASAVADEVLKTVNILATTGNKSVYKATDYSTTDDKDLTDITDNENGYLVMRVITGKNLKSMGLYFYSSTYGKP